jgi:hypothetical protein
MLLKFMIELRVFLSAHLLDSDAFKQLTHVTAMVNLRAYESLKVSNKEYLQRG